MVFAVDVFTSFAILGMLLGASAHPLVDVRRSGAETGRSTRTSFSNQNKVQIQIRSTFTLLTNLLTVAL
jgi:hypothetical protein